MPAPSITATALGNLLTRTVGEETTRRLFTMIEIDPALLSPVAPLISRAVLAQAMNMILFLKNLDAVPEGCAYVNDALQAGRKVNFDHGALRTVDTANTGALPRGEAAFKRILEPLGYTVASLYPLPRLKMTGRAYCHQDYPETLAQFFVSELHVNQFSTTFEVAAERVVSTSKDPLSARHKALLDELATQKALPADAAAELLPALVNCFDVQHDTPALADYEALLAESAEMAWIATEGNSFNHATDRVADVFAVADAQRAAGRSIKDKVEVSADGRVRQTAFKAAPVQRQFIGNDGKTISRTVPGSFYEFITRDRFPADETGQAKLALHFDTSNAQGIFKMTDAAAM